MPNKSSWIAICLSAGALTIAVPAKAAFAPIRCPPIGGATNEVPYVFDSHIEQYNFGGNYGNKINVSRKVLANKYAWQFRFWLDDFYTESGFDFLDLNGGAWKQSGNLSASLPAWQTPGWHYYIQRDPWSFKFSTDSSLTRPGFRLSKLDVHCSSTGESAFQATPSSVTERLTGVLLGTGDVVNTFFPGNYSNLTITLWGTAGTDFDVYAKCGSPPTDTNWDVKGYATGSNEFVDIPNFFGTTACGAGNLYVAVHSYAGKGQFNLLVAPTKPLPLPANSNIRVGLEWYETDPAVVSRVSDFLKLTSRFMFGLTEGQTLQRQYTIHYGGVGGGGSGHDPSTHCSYGCGGVPCTVCIHAQDDLGEVGTLLGQCPPNNPNHVAHILRSQVTGAGWASYVPVLAHELGHCQYGLQDEYIPTPAFYNACMHSVMTSASGNGTLNNFCTAHDHGADRTPGSPAPPFPSPWSTPSFTNWMPVSPSAGTTPDNESFAGHTFNGAINVVTTL